MTQTRTNSKSPAPAKLTREAWLEAATDEYRADFAALGSPLPENVRVSCGFSSKGARSRRIGECWSPSASEAGVPEVFIVPGISDSIEVGAILVHELVHAAGHMDHGSGFRKVAKALGLEGKMTSTVPGEKTKARLAEIVEKIGAYPHSKLSAGTGGNAKKQTTRMLKVECSCGCIARMTAKWIEEVGAPTCGCGEQMEPAA